MPHYTSTLELACPAADLFAFLARPKNLAQLAPPDLHLELVTGPDIMELGSRLAWKARRWGIAQNFTQEVTDFDQERRVIVEQKQGPFARWIHSLRFKVIDAGTQLHEQIDFDPPSGLLGRLISADFIRQDLDKLYAYREEKLRALFAV